MRLGFALVEEDGVAGRFARKIEGVRHVTEANGCAYKANAKPERYFHESTSISLKGSGQNRLLSTLFDIGFRRTRTD